MRQLVVNGFFLDPKYRNYGMRHFALRMLSVISSLDESLEIVLVVPKGCDLEGVGLPNKVSIHYVRSYFRHRFPILRELFKNVQINYAIRRRWPKSIAISFLPSPFFIKPKYFINSLHDCLPYIQKELIEKYDIEGVRIGFADRMFWRLVKFSMKRSDCIITVSEQAESEIREIIGERSNIQVIPNWIEPVKEFSAETKARLTSYDLPRKYIFYSGGYHFRKNFSELIKAFQVFSKSHPDVWLVATGGESSGAQEVVKDLVGDDQVVDRIRFLGSVHLDDMPGIYQLASLVVYPSLYEGFGLPVLESMAYKVPFIASSLECIREFNTNMNCLYEPGSHDALAEKMSSCMKDPQSYLASYPDELKIDSIEIRMRDFVLSQLANL